MQLKAKAPDVPEEIAIEAAIKGLQIGPFAAHLARKKPTSIQQLYDEFEKYYRSDNDLRKKAGGAGSKQTAKQQQKFPENLYEPECIKSETRPGASAQHQGSTSPRARATGSASTAEDPDQEPRSARLPRQKLEQKPQPEATQAILRFFTAKA